MPVIYNYRNIKKIFEKVWQRLQFFLLQTCMISVDGLSKFIDCSQLTREFEGSLEYNHEQWIQLRLVNLHVYVVYNLVQWIVLCVYMWHLNGLNIWHCLYWLTFPKDEDYKIYTNKSVLPVLLFTLILLRVYTTVIFISFKILLHVSLTGY